MKTKQLKKFFVVTWWKFCSHSIVCLKDIRTFVNTLMPITTTRIPSHTLTHSYRPTHIHIDSRKRVHVVLFMARL